MTIAEAPCPSRSVLEQFLRESLVADEAIYVGKHIDECTSCQALLDELVDEVPDCFARHVAQRAAPEDHREAAPASIGGHRVLRELGAGMYGVVYLAHHKTLDRLVAIKVPRGEAIQALGGNELYLKEARALARLDHPHIVRVHDANTTEDNSCYIVSQYIEGCSLAARLTQGRLNFVEAAALVAHLADALQHAHEKGFFHRDVKPANVLLDVSGKPYLTDFGLALNVAELGRGPRLLGTPEYMSPEQARGEGHRVDGRTDIFSLGVVFYEALTGKRPFEAASPSELLELIADNDAQPPRQRDKRIPLELDEFCRKALARRLHDRYSSASELAEKLRAWLARETPAAQPSTLPATPAATPPHLESAATPPPPAVRITPRGLRSFDAADAGFFLKLTPGPHDRDGLPESLRFWNQRIEDTDDERTFAVGVLYGPSGCGKSSLVKAGLLPRLAAHVAAVHIDCTQTGTENRLRRRLRKECPDLESDLDLAASLAALRRERSLTPGRKVLLVLDQFEQWLLAQHQEEDAELVRALRQCDGGRVQALILVRDDFSMAVNRFFARLEIPLEQHRNWEAVDLFDLRHARKVLEAFGRAYGAIPEDEAPTREHLEFLEQAVKSLAVDGRVTPVRLALFAQMVNGEAWTPATLRAKGGAEGVGVTFLDETFSDPQHRSHQGAAQAVLRALLPKADGDIRGRPRSRNELLAASGYGSRPKEFEELLRMLDTELRLLTPCEPDTDASAETDAAGTSQSSPQGQSADVLGARCYQLTHDYLVPSLRTWLTQAEGDSPWPGRVTAGRSSRSLERASGESSASFVLAVGADSQVDATEALDAAGAQDDGQGDRPPCNAGVAGAGRSCLGGGARLEQLRIPGPAGSA